tara:strand:- start:2209 stop:3183 length:975 start_codon:yes stop_codon:yes gene_type:complete
MTNYNFGEKEQEYHAGQQKNMPVWQSPKYIQSKGKAVELIELDKYGLDAGDFWILMNATKSGKMMYTGLIISHNGCLKINDKLDDKLKFRPSSVSLLRDVGNKEKVMDYICDEQGVYEFGEISPNNCKNDYPYAMVLKRLMDRVILKTSKVGFFGIYSEAESEDFKNKVDETETDKTPEEEVNEGNLENWYLTKEGKDWLIKTTTKITNELQSQEFEEVITKNKVDLTRMLKNCKEEFYKLFADNKHLEELFKFIKTELEQSATLADFKNNVSLYKKSINLIGKYRPALFDKLIECRDIMEKDLSSADKITNELGDNVDYGIAG